MSGCLVSSRYYCRRNCYLHLLVVAASTSVIATVELLVVLDLIARGIELKRVKFAWDFLPFTVSYNETVRIKSPEISLNVVFTSHQAGLGSRVYLVTANLVLCLSLSLAFSVFSSYVALR